MCRDVASAICAILAGDRGRGSRIKVITHEYAPPEELPPANGWRRSHVSEQVRSKQ
jgi:hypothetical protein